MKKTNEILKAQRLLQQGDFENVIKILNSVETSSTKYCDAQILKIRCLLEQGRILAAKESLNLVQQDFLKGEDKIRFKLWKGFISLYGVSKQISVDRWTNLEQICSDVLSNPSNSPSLKALAFDLDARLKAWKISLGHDSPCKRDNAIKQMGKAVEIYAEIGEHRESLLTKRRQAQFCCHKPLPNISLARQLYEEIKHESDTIEDLVIKAEAYLALAEIYFEQVYGEPKTDNSKKIIQKFEEVGQLFEQAEHRYGEAKVVLSFGQLLLKYGCEDGVNLTLQAIEELANKNEMVLRQGGWRSLSIWHTYHGNYEQAREALQRSQQLSAEMQFDLSQSIDFLGEGDYAFRRGDISTAREVLNQSMTSSEDTGLGIAYRQVLATITGSIGLFEETEQLLNGIIEQLNAHGPSSSLSETLYILAHHLLSKDYTKAMQCMNRAIKIDEELKDSIGKAHHLCDQAWMQVQNNLKTNQVPLITEEIELCFDRSRDLLLANRTLEAQMQLGSLCQLRGQAYFFAKDWERCGTWFTLAKELYRTYKLLPSLAFTLNSQGLAMIEVGRIVGIQAYEEAEKRLRESQEIFEQIGLQGVLWRVLFHRGLCEYEAGRLESSNSVRQKERWIKSKNFLDEAANQIDRLRGFSDKRSAIHQQNTWISFGIDKQTVYDVGFQLAWFWQKDSAMALVWLERMKGRALLDALANITLPSSQIIDNELIKEEQKLLIKKKSSVDVEEAIEVQKELDLLLNKMSQSPSTRGYASLRSGEPPTWKQLKETLKREQQTIENQRFLVVEYYCTPQYTLVFGMCADWSEPKVEIIQINYRSLCNFIELNFRQSDGVRMMIEDIGEKPWHKFSGLLSPLLKWSELNDIICLIPHGILHDLPLHTLLVEDNYLIDRNPVFYCPSISVLQYILQRDYESNKIEQNNYRGAVFGDSRDNLPSSRDEAIDIAQLMKINAAQLGESVTRQNFLDALSNVDILHFAGHGKLSASDGFDSGLQLANKDTLKASELFNISTSAELIVLSGCETGVSEKRTGDELIGLVRSFLYAGANTLLVSQWRVSDESTKELLTIFYSYIFEESTLRKVEALQKAIKNMREHSCWQSLYHWGGFVLIGDWK